MDKLYTETGKKRDCFDGAIDLLSKIIKNIIENPDDEKYRSIRRDNPKIKDNLTGFKSAIEIMKLLGFQEVKDSSSGDVSFKINLSVSVSFIKVSSLWITFNRGEN